MKIHDGKDVIPEELVPEKARSRNLEFDQKHSRIPVSTGMTKRRQGEPFYLSR
jgi:hypothetical protein